MAKGSLAQRVTGLTAASYPPSRRCRRAVGDAATWDTQASLKPGRCELQGSSTLPRTPGLGWPLRFPASPLHRVAWAVCAARASNGPLRRPFRLAPCHNAHPAIFWSSWHLQHEGQAGGMHVVFFFFAIHHDLCMDPFFLTIHTREPNCCVIKFFKSIRILRDIKTEDYMKDFENDRSYFYTS
jgi:hypothetical protein